MRSPNCRILAADEVLGERADEGGEADEEQQAEAENVAAEHVRGVVAAGDERDDLVVDEAHEPPDQVGGEKHRQDDDEAGEEVVAQALRQRGLRFLRTADGLLGHGKSSDLGGTYGGSGEGTSAVVRGNAAGGRNGGMCRKRLEKAHPETVWNPYGIRMGGC